MALNVVRRCLLFGLVVLGLLSAVPAAEAAVKPYSLTISPATVAGGAKVTFTATFTVPADAQQQLGSANVTPPTGFTLIAGSVTPATAGSVGGGVLQLRNLAVQPGTSRTVTVDANVPCAAITNAAWTVKAKQANDFNGPPGNDLTLVGDTPTTSVTGGCGTALRFVNQPRDAQPAAIIPGAPSSPVSVEVVDSANNRVTTASAPITLTLTVISGSGGLSGTTTVNARNGVAEFPDLRVANLGVYRLTASSPGLAGASSDAFHIDTVVAVCPAGGTCTGSANTGPSTLTITGQAAAEEGVLRLSFDVGFVLNCAGYTELTPGTALFTVTANREKLASLRIDSTVMNAQPDNGVGTMQLCFGSPARFTTRAGTPALSSQPRAFDWDGDGTLDTVFFGLLPDCNPQQGPPCVSNRQKNGVGDGIIEARIPGGLADPLMRG